jgi:hypothetical protein
MSSSFPSGSSMVMRERLVDQAETINTDLLAWLPS